MKKRKLFLYIFILLSIFILFFVGTIILISNRHWFYSYETFLEYEYDSNNDDRIDDLKEDLNNLLKDGSDYNSFKNKYNELYQIYEEIYDDYKIEYLNVCNKPLKGNVRYLDIYSKKKDDLQTYFGSLYEKINNSNFKNDFFNGYSDNDISYLIKYNSEEAKNKNKEISEIISGYSNLSDTEKKEQFAKYYSNLVAKSNEYAKLLNYDNYFLLSNNKEYYRDYTKEDVIQFANYINEYFIKNYNIGRGIYYTAYSNYKRYHLNSNFVNKMAYNDLALNYETNNHSKYNDILNSYSSYMGGNYDVYYKDFVSNGYLIESNNEDNFDGAFTTYLPYRKKPVMYLGNNDYQTLFVYTHEFGHYYNFINSGNNNVSLDLCETHSQSNELLLLRYIATLDNFSNSEKNHIIATRLEYFTRMAIHTAIIGLVELKAYNTENLTEELASTLIDDVVNEYFPNLYDIFNEDYIKNYIMKVIISNQMYYFSYSTSIISSLDIFSISINNFDTAKEKYEYIQDYNNYNGYINTINQANLNSPFEENTYIKLKQTFNNL